ncbi:MAG: universal stress protein [Saprospiraceae bacterium]|nr:universal stress protein [Saprospiraceae bacterium]
MSTNKHILAAIDFNESSEMMLEYLSQYADKNDKITLLHVLNQGYMGVNLSGGILPFDAEAKRLKEMTGQYFEGFDDVENQIGFDPNDAGDGIVRYADSNDVDTIFIASRDKHTLMDKILGSTCLRVVNSAPCDVVVIPHGTKYRPMEKLILAADKGVSDLLTAERFESWKGCQVFFVHIIEDDQDDFDDEKKQLMVKLFDQNDVDFSFGVETLKSQDTVKAILSFAHNENADAVLLRKSNQSLISTLFLSSTTKEIIDKTILPLIFITTK